MRRGARPCGGETCLPDGEADPMGMRSASLAPGGTLMWRGDAPPRRGGGPNGHEERVPHAGERVPRGLRDPLANYFQKSTWPTANGPLARALPGERPRGGANHGMGRGHDSRGRS